MYVRVLNTLVKSLIFQFMSRFNFSRKNDVQIIFEFVVD